MGEIKANKAIRACELRMVLWAPSDLNVSNGRLFFGRSIAIHSELRGCAVFKELLLKELGYDHGVVPPGTVFAFVFTLNPSQFVSRVFLLGIHMVTRELAHVMEPPGRTEDVDELSLLLPSWQIMALAKAAEDQGVTVAQFMRRLVNQALAHC